MKDVLCKYLALNNEVRVYTLTSQHLVNAYLENVPASPVATAAIGRLLSGTLLMAATLKGDEKISVSIEGDGPIGALKTEADTLGNVRGFVTNPLCDVPLKENGHLDVAKAVGNGILTVKKQLNMKEPFVGSCELISGEIAEDLSYYYGISEQTPTIIGLGVLIDVDYKVKTAGGFMIQVLPNASEETYVYLENLLVQIQSVTNLIQKIDDGKDFIHQLFSESTFLESYPVAYRCICSKNYAKNFIRHLQLSELEEIIKEDKKLEITCNFCQKKYEFDENELLEIKKEME